MEELLEHPMEVLLEHPMEDHLKTLSELVTDHADNPPALCSAE